MTHHTRSRLGTEVLSALLATAMGICIGLALVWWWSCESAC